MTLAIDGGKPEVVGPLKRFNGIGRLEAAAARTVVLDGSLSGFLGGEPRGGRWVRALEDKWAETFEVKHAVACNSATSGLLAACHAVGIELHDLVITTPFTMSATAAAPRWLGANLHFADVDDQAFCLHDRPLLDWRAKAVIVTNLFGHPAHLGDLRNDCSERGIPLIEDNAQAPFATEDGRYAGTFGDIGVFSLNVHKHIQCGEGGVCVTNEDDLAERLRGFINHGELAGGALGLNLRMTEVTAAIALAQLARGKPIVDGRIAQAEAIIAAIGPIPGLRPPVVRNGCKHVYYTIPFLIEDNRARFVQALLAEGVPLTEGYGQPLYRLPAFAPFARPCPMADALHDRRLFTFENCGYDPSPEQTRQIGNAFQKVAERMGAA
jgi:perosamine synthetase